jgi:2-isopropylmalate synthase
MHVNAVLKRPDSFEHMDPEIVGNQRRILVSDVAGTSTIAAKLHLLWPHLDRRGPVVRQVLDRVKEMENQGYEFEAAEASLMLLAEEVLGERRDFFKLHGYRVLSGKHEEASAPFAEATVEIGIDGVHYHTAANGTGPVNALDSALRKALLVAYPQISKLELQDYKVRVLEGTHGTATGVRVIIETSDGRESWGTVGVHANVIEASWRALVDSIAYGLQHTAGPDAEAGA